MAEIERLIELGVERDTPLDLLRTLREAQPNVELVHISGNRWWLGLVRANPSQHLATMPMGETPGSADRSKKVLLQRQGFRFLGEYTDEQLLPTFLREELDYMLNRTEKEVEASYFAAVAASDYSENHEQAIVKSIMDKVGAEGRSIWAKAARGRVSVGVNGLRGT